VRCHAHSVAVAWQVVVGGVVDRGAVVPDRHRVLGPVVAHLELLSLGDVAEQEAQDRIWKGIAQEGQSDSTARRIS
jgi:hypothetical protein